MLMSSKNQPGYALSLKGGTTGRCPVLPRVFMRQYRALPEVLLFVTDMLLVFLSTTAPSRYYRTFDNTGRGPVLPRFHLRQYRAARHLMVLATDVLLAYLSTTGPFR